MPERPLQVGLEATDQRSDQFILTFNSSRYPVVLNPEADHTFSDWLRRLPPILVGGDDATGSTAPNTPYKQERKSMAKQKPTPAMTPNMVTQHLATLQAQRKTAFSAVHPWTERRFAGKTLWEWMSLLLVPLFIGVGTIGVTYQQTYSQNEKSEQLQTSAQMIAQEQRLDDLLRVYRDGIDTLLLSNGLRQSQPNDDVRRIAHSRTLDILRQADPKRKTSVIYYLADLELIQGSFNKINKERVSPLVSLSFANLSETNLSFANLSFADLRFANLSRANLSRANLSDADIAGTDLNFANLSRADLSETNLSETNLSFANLSFANLSRADLGDADLTGVHLSQADLSFANLMKANITDEQLKQAKSLQDAIMPDGLQHP